MKEQREFIERIAALIKENPDLEARFMVASDEVSEDYKYTAHLIQRVELDVIYECNEGYLVGEEEIREYLEDEGISKHPADNIMDNLKLNILVYTGAL